MLFIFMRKPEIPTQKQPQYQCKPVVAQPALANSGSELLSSVVSQLTSSISWAGLCIPHSLLLLTTLSLSLYPHPHPHPLFNFIIISLLYY